MRKFVSLKAMSEESSGVASAMKTGNETSSVRGKFKYNSSSENSALLCPVAGEGLEKGSWPSD